MFKDKIVLITGASSGIGQSCAEQFAALGARLIIIARRTDKLQDLQSKLANKYKTESFPLVLDIGLMCTSEVFCDNLVPTCIL